MVFCTALAPETPPDVLFQPDYILNKDHKSSDLLNSTVTKAFRLFHNMLVFSSEKYNFEWPVCLPK